MKNILYGALIGLVVAVAIISTGAGIEGAPFLAYVFSDSMEPLIKVHDAFFVWPTTNVKVGDIIMYRPVVLRAPYITHRIIDTGESGYITKGDNSPYKDQDSGEPEVLNDRIIGKVVTINGQPFIIPGLGSLSEAIQSKLGNYTGYLWYVFLVLAIITAFSGKSSRDKYKRKPRHRMRLGDIYRIIILFIVAITVISIYVGSTVAQVKYLVSEYPGNLGDQVEVNKPGTLLMVVRNSGWVPVWAVLTGIPPLSVREAQELIWPRSFGKVTLDVLPHRSTGVYMGYVQVHNYPAVLPKTLVLYLHNISPALAIITTAIGMGLWFTLFFALLNYIPGFHHLIPLKAIRDKITENRLKRARAKYFGRRRIR